VKGGSRLAFEGFEIVRCMSTVPDDTARERWWTVSWLSHKTKIPDVRCGGRGRRRGQLSIARRFRIVVRRDHGTHGARWKDRGHRDCLPWRMILRDTRRLR